VAHSTTIDPFASGIGRRIQAAVRIEECTRAFAIAIGGPGALGETLSLTNGEVAPL
jgi:hypothetical protein